MVWPAHHLRFTATCTSAEGHNYPIITSRSRLPAITSCHSYPLITSCHSYPLITSSHLSQVVWPAHNLRFTATTSAEGYSHTPINSAPQLPTHHQRFPDRTRHQWATATALLAGRSCPAGHSYRLIISGVTASSLLPSWSCLTDRSHVLLACGFLLAIHMIARDQERVISSR